MLRRDKLLSALSARGWIVDEKARSSKYTVMRKEGEKSHMFIGASGALRMGVTVGNSLSLTGSKFYNSLIGE